MRSASLAERLRLAYFPKNAVIVSPETGVVKVFRIIQRGKILAREASELGAPRTIDHEP